MAAFCSSHRPAVNVWLAADFGLLLRLEQKDLASDQPCVVHVWSLI